MWCAFGFWLPRSKKYIIGEGSFEAQLPSRPGITLAEGWKTCAGDAFTYDLCASNNQRKSFKLF